MQRHWSQRDASTITVPMCMMVTCSLVTSMLDFGSTSGTTEIYALMLLIRRLCPYQWANSQPEFGIRELIVQACGSDAENAAGRIENICKAAHVPFHRS